MFSGRRIKPIIIPDIPLISNLPPPSAAKSPAISSSGDQRMGAIIIAKMLQLIVLTIGVTLAAALVSGSSSSTSLPSGASPAFTSNEPDIVHARDLYNEGRYLEA